MKNNNYILFTFSSVTDIVYFNTVIEKIKKYKFNILLITTENCIKDVLLKKIIFENNIEVLTLRVIELKITENLENKIKPTLIYNINLLKLNKFFFRRKIIKTYFFNEFHNDLMFQVLPFSKKVIFIQSLQYLKVTNVRSESEFVSQFGDPMNKDAINVANKNIQFYKNLLNIDLLFSKYGLDDKYFKKGNIYNFDYYKVVGFSIKDDFRQIKINPSYPFKTTSPKDEILFLFTKIEDINNFGINFESSYQNMFRYIKKLNKPITIKLHPNFNKELNTHLKKELQNLNAKIIYDNNAAEYYMSDFKYIVCTTTTNAFKNFTLKNYSSNYKLISLINFIDCEDKKIWKKLQQILYTVSYNNYEYIIRPKITDLSS